MGNKGLDEGYWVNAMVCIRKGRIVGESGREAHEWVLGV